MVTQEDIPTEEQPICQPTGQDDVIDPGPPLSESPPTDAEPPVVESVEEAPVAQDQAATTAGPEDPAERLTRVEQSVRRLEEALADLKDLRETSGKVLAILEDSSNLDQARESAVQKMHEELTAYRQKGVEHSKKAVLQSLLVLYDNVEQCMDEVDGEARRSVDWLREMLLETLYREDVEPIEDTAETLDKVLHKVVRSVPAEQLDLDRTIEQVVKRGFRWHGELLRREHVVVRRFSGAGQDEAAEESQEPPPAETIGETAV